MNVVIRDDDLCYWSKWKDFEFIYSQLGVPVSVSLVLNGANMHGNSMPYGNFDKFETKKINDNHELCDYLRKQIKNKKIEILMHGFTHEFKTIKNERVPEMLWRDNNFIRENLPIYKLELESLFNCKINFFISPADKCKKSFYKELKKNKLNTCGLISSINSRPFSFCTLKNFLIRNINRIKYKYPYTGIMKYNGFFEIMTYQNLNFDYLVKTYNFLKSKNYDMVVEVHYWDLLKNPSKILILDKFISYCRNNGAHFCLISDLIKDQS